MGPQILQNRGLDAPGGPRRGLGGSNGEAWADFKPREPPQAQNQVRHAVQNGAQNRSKFEKNEGRTSFKIFVIRTNDF